MAIYHCSIKNIGRSSGRSAVASSAYRSGEKLEDKETGLIHDFTRKGSVEFTEVILCKNAPEEYRNREILWNEVQRVEKSSDARLAREWEVAIPNELNKEQTKELVHSFGQSLADEGMCIDLAIHWKSGNHHAHIMGTTRKINENGQWGKKERKDYAVDEQGNRIPVIDPVTGQQKLDRRNRKQWKRITVEANDWNKSEKVEEWRERWEKECNKYLEHQIDHRSYERQGKELVPTIHEGYVARKMESKQEGSSDRVQLNKNIRDINDQLTFWNRQLLELSQRREQISAEFQKLKDRLVEKARKLNERIHRIIGERQADGRDDGFVRKSTDRDTTVKIRDFRERINTFRSTESSRGMESKGGRIGEREYGIIELEQKVERREPDIMRSEQEVTDLEQAVKQKAREISERFAKYRRNVELTGRTGQEDIGTEPKDDQIAIAEFRASRSGKQVTELTERRSAERERVKEPEQQIERKSGTRQAARKIDRGRER